MDESTLDKQRDKQPSPAPSAARQLIDNPWIMLATLFLVTAALGLPFLWMSRGFSRTSKVILSIVVIVYTALILWIFWIIMAWCIQRIVDAM